jgi:hypothetical protein
MRGKAEEVKRAEAAVAAAQKRADELEARILKLDEDAAIEQGKYKELYESQKTRAEELESKHNALVERETKRLKEIADSNKERRKALPKELQELIPSGLSADAEALQLNRLEAITGGGEDGGSGIFSGMPRPKKRQQTADEEISALHKRCADVQLGRRPIGDPGGSK